MSNNRVRAVRLVLLLVVVLLIGTLGYRILLGWTWLEAFYFTVITISTVGYGEIHELGEADRVFTIFLMFTSVGIVMYSASALAEIVVETRFSGLRRRRRMQSRIDRISDHYIICGYGRTGSSVFNSLRRSRHPLVVVETSADKVAPLQEENLPVVVGDATEDECLNRAGIARARGLIAALGNDAENVYLILSARALNRNITIVSWATSVEAESKILRAGATHVISPYLIAGVRMAHLLETPHALAFFDHAMSRRTAEFQLGEILIRGDSPLIENSLKSLNIRRDVGVIVVGIRRADGSFQFNPPADTVFQEGDMLIGMGSEQQLEQLREMI